MISSVTLKNYKAHRDTTIELGRFTVLVGPNGSGKTSVLEAIDKLARWPRDGWSDMIQPGTASTAPRQYRRGATEPLAVVARGRIADADASVGFFWDSSEVKETNPGFRVRWAKGDASGHEPQLFADTLSELGAATFYRFASDLLARPSQSLEERPQLQRDGSNAADVLASLKLEDEVLFERIQDTLRMIVPRVKRIRIQRQRLGRWVNDTNPIGQKIVLDFQNAPDVPAEDVSEGTLTTLALLTAVCTGPRRRVLLLDDLGLSLHPTAQMELVRQLHRMLEQDLDVQILATTHSPYIVDEMKPEDVVVLAPRTDGTIASKRLSEHPEATKMKGVLGAGQIWSLDPEQSWVAGSA